MDCWLCKAPAIGALVFFSFYNLLAVEVGFVAVFVLRQRFDQRCQRRSAAHGTSYFPKHGVVSTILMWTFLNASNAFAHAFWSYVASWRSSSVLAYRSTILTQSKKTRCRYKLVGASDAIIG
ncbi:Multidrug resistance MdtL [Gossypium arboreum]|uniref:Multidrug resistance MdtL n=1 Tax=Gossypium arboreum TaxID=29729 RepID=A0A0B0MGM7_GOSAR|nr:Multidrug resistance MdtL [Gossypium arboreum]